MLVVAPLSDPGEVVPLCEAGADELYCGVLTEAWREAYTPMQSPNRRDVARASLGSFDELADVVRAAHARGVRVSYVSNVHYEPSQYAPALADVGAAVSAEVDAVVVADLGFAHALRRTGTGGEVDLQVSTVASIYSSAAARPWARLGARRVILPRDLTLAEAGRLSAALAGLGLGAEALAFNMVCKFSDGFCAHDHGGAEWDGVRTARPEDRELPLQIEGAIMRPSLLNLVANRVGKDGMGQACMLPYEVEVVQQPEGAGAAVAEAFDTASALWTHLDGCAGCQLPRLAAAGVAAVKIVGRVLPRERKVADVRFARAAMGLGAAGDGARDAVRALHRDVYGHDCSGFCYYG